MMKKTANRQGATDRYQLHQAPMFVEYEHGGMTYRSHLDGRTFAIIGGFPVPCPCPCPEKVMWANLVTWGVGNARGIFNTALAAVALVAVYAALIAVDNEGAYMAADAIAAISAFLTATLVLLACLTATAFALSQFKRGLRIEVPIVSGLLEAPGTDGIEVLPDVAVFSASEKETPEEYAARLDAALKSANGAWVVVMPYRSEYGVIQTGGGEDEAEGYVFLRSLPIHDGGDVVTYEQAAKAEAVFAREKWADYVGYCREFSARFKGWAKLEKIREGANPLKVIVRAAAMFALLLFANTAFAQKTAAVMEYLGKMRYETKPVGEVSYVFERRVYTRNGSGSQDYGQLLASAPRFNDAKDDGRLIGISLNDETVLPVNAPAPKERQVVDGSEGGRGFEKVPTMPSVQSAKGMFDALPDSGQLAEMKRAHLRERASNWAKLEPVIDYWMWRFWNLMTVICGLCGVLYILARVSATDAIVDIRGYPLIGNVLTSMHIATKSAMFLILCIPTAIILLVDVIRYYYTQDFNFFWLIKYAIICYLWYLAFEKILPDSPGDSGKMGGGMGNYPRIGGGGRGLNG